MTRKGFAIPQQILVAARKEPGATTSRTARSSQGLPGAARGGLPALAVPEELGGFGLTLAEVVREQRRLAYHAAPTALAINMHLYWTGVAADLWRAGDTSLKWLLEEAAHGRGVRGRPRRERQRHPGAAVDHEGRTRGRRLPVHRTQVVRQPDPGLDVSGHPRDGHERSRAAENRARLHAARRRRATESRRRGTCSACAPRAATTRSSKAPSFPIDTSPAWCPRERPGSTRSCSASSRGRCSASATSITACAPARSISPSRR